jgi:hypothetical protein
MQQPGLYFPFVHVRDDDWLKVAALYWPSVRRLVPRGYAKHDSPTAQTFFDARILLDEAPEELIYSMAWDLLRTLRENADRLMRDYSLDRAYADWDGQPWSEGTAPHWGNPALAWIHLTKFPRGVVKYLCDMGLAHQGRSGGRAGCDPRVREEWIGLHPALAGAYMTALAARVSQRAHFQPLTDQSDLRVATPTSDVRAALHLLLGRKTNAQEQLRSAAGVETYIMLAVQHVCPTNLESVTASKIVQCRRNLGEELATFRDYVAAQQSELAVLAALPLERRRLEAFAEHVAHTVELPLRRLEKGLLLHRLEPTRSLLLAGTIAPPAAAGVALNAIGAAPAAVTAVGVMAAVGSAWWQVGNIRADVKASSPVGYLLDIRDHLTPKSLAAGARKVLRGTYGRG